MAKEGVPKNKSKNRELSETELEAQEIMAMKSGLVRVESKSPAEVPAAQTEEKPASPAEEPLPDTLEDLLTDQAPAIEVKPKRKTALRKKAVGKVASPQDTKNDFAEHFGDSFAGDQFTDEQIAERIAAREFEKERLLKEKALDEERAQDLQDGFIVGDPVPDTPEAKVEDPVTTPDIKAEAKSETISGEPADAYEALKEGIASQPAVDPVAEQFAKDASWRGIHPEYFVDGEKEPAPPQSSHTPDSEGFKNLHGKDFTDALNNAESLESEKSSPNISLEDLHKHTKDREAKIAAEGVEKGVGEKGLTFIRSVGEWYKTQPTWKKVAFAGSMMGLSVAGGVFTGGALGVALISAGMTGSAFNRVAASAAAFVTAEELSRRFWKSARDKKNNPLINRNVGAGLFAAVLVGAMPTIMRESGAGAFMGHNLSLAGSWLSSHFNPIGPAAYAAEAAVGVEVLQDLPLSETPTPVSSVDFAASEQGGASTSKAAPLKVSIPDSGNNIPGGLESSVNSNSEQLMQASSEVNNLTPDITVPKGSDAWTEILKSLPKDLSPQGQQNMTGNIEAYLRAHPDLNPDIKDISKIKPGTVIKLPPASEMANWHDKAVTRFGAASPKAALSSAVHEMKPAPKLPVPLQDLPLPPRPAPFPAPIEAFKPAAPTPPIHIATQPPGVDYSAPAYSPNSTSMHDFYSPNSQPNYYGAGGGKVPHPAIRVEPHQILPGTSAQQAQIATGLHAQRPNFAPMQAPGVAIPELTPHDALNNYVQNAFPAKGFMALFTTETGIPDAWNNVGHMKASEILDPEKTEQLQGMTKKVALRMSRDVQTVLQAAPDMRASNATVQQILEEGFRRKILKTA